MYKEGKWASQIIALQEDDGKWGWFHSLSQFYNSPITTEQALGRLQILGFTIEDECIQKAVQYTMMKYGYDLLRGALYDSSQETSVVEEYQRAMNSRADEIRRITEEISDYDAVLITGPTYVNHLCGLPTITVAGGIFDTDGVRQAVMLYGADKFRLYAAALTVEQLLNS